MRIEVGSMKVKRCDEPAHSPWRLSLTSQAVNLIQFTHCDRSRAVELFAKSRLESRLRRSLLACRVSYAACAKKAAQGLSRGVVARRDHTFQRL